MLPSKFFAPPSNHNDRNNNNGRPPPLGMTGVMCSSDKLEVAGRGSLYYRVFRPRQLKHKPPLVLVHGGPLIPCNYLLPLAYVVVDRSIVVYDQLGCGQSAKIFNVSVLTKEGSKNRLDVEGMVRDLELLMDHWNFERYHLLGHSFGGILIFEYLKHCRARGMAEKLDRCLSVVLASAPTSVKLVEQEVQRLCQELGTNLQDDDEDEEDGVRALQKKVPKAFREKHECRLVPIPFPLADSYNQTGPKHLRGLESIGDYVASATTKDDDQTTTKLPQPALILRGQHDFVTETCVEGWDSLFDGQHMTLAGCSHYGMLENETMYGSVISSFLGDCEKK